MAGCLSERENPLVQKIDLKGDQQQLIASPDGSKGSLQLRQQVWLHHIELKKVNRRASSFMAREPICSPFTERCMRSRIRKREALTCGDGAFIRDEANITLVADTPLRAVD